MILDDVGRQKITQAASQSDKSDVEPLKEDLCQTLASLCQLHMGKETPYSDNLCGVHEHMSFDMLGLL